MKIENQVVSLELSKKLKEMGYPQEGLWWWLEEGEWREDRIAGPYQGKTNSGKFVLKRKDNFLTGWKHCVAPTAAELGKELPSWFEDRGIYIFNDCDQWFVQLRMYSFGKMICDVNDEILANAMAKMWLYLKTDAHPYEIFA